MQELDRLHVTLLLWIIFLIWKSEALAQASPDTRPNIVIILSCSPTRSMLLSGTDTHLNGLGNMDEWTAPNQAGRPGHEGTLCTPLEQG